MPTASLTTLANGARQFVVHDALEMTWCLSLSYWSKLTPSTTVMSSPLAGAEMMTFFAPAVEVLGGVVALGEEAGRLDDDVDAEVAPRQRGGVALGEDLELVAVDDEAVVRRPRPCPGTGRGSSRT